MSDKRKVISGSVLAVGLMMFIAYVFIFNIKTTLIAARDFLITRDLASVSSSFENNFNSSFPQKSLFVDINGLGHRFFYQRKMTDVFLLENGHGSVILGDYTDEALQVNANAIAQFSDWFERERGGNFLYVQVPMKNSKYDSMLPAGIKDTSNEIADHFLANLEGRVDKLDLREAIEEEQIDFYSLYLKTEHHWNVKGGFFAFQKICEYMQNYFGEEIDPAVLLDENYEYIMLDESSLGYYGQKVGQYFLGYDEFPLLNPKFDTKQSCTIVHRDVVRSGSFYDAIFDKNFLSAPKRDRGLYGMFIGGDFPLVIHRSETAKNPGTVMIFIDSFGTIIESYLTTAYQNVIAVDLRWVKLLGWEETAYDYINRYEPDTIIVAFNPNQLVYPASEQFTYGLPADDIS